MLYHVYKLGLVGRKRARCKERAAKTGSEDPLSHYDPADGPFPTNAAGGGQKAVDFVACRQSIHQYAFLRTSCLRPSGHPPTPICRRDRALKTLCSKDDASGIIDRHTARFGLSGNSCAIKIPRHVIVFCGAHYAQDH